MRTRLVLILAALALSTGGCAECWVDSLDALVTSVPEAYSTGGSVESKQADIDARIEESKRLGELEN